jgi:predicted DsbA family dithiol-disulfide isomerase
VRIDIWSDIVCPWCYIGKRRFEQALGRFEGRASVDIIHHSFQLNPAAPRDRTTDRREMLMRKYRLSAQQVEEMDARMTQTAAAEGLDYHLTGTVSGNTFDAHQLVHFAHEHHRQDEMLERLYRAYFVDQRPIFDPSSLAVLAGEIGLDQTDAAAALSDGRYATLVDQDMETARRLGITGVPFFVIDQRLGVSGAQSPEVLLDVLRRAAAETVTTP